MCDILNYSSVWLGKNCYGLFEISSLINHSCHPNCSYHYQNGALQLHLRQNIEFRESDELFICYVDEDKDYAERREQLHDKYGFWCSCQRCLHQ